MRAKTGRVAAVALVTAVWLACQGPASAGLLRQDSANFDWQYEMDISPELEDLDSDSNPDWAKSGTGSSVSGGILTYDTMPSGNLSLNSNNTGSGGIWPGKYTLASGFTVEARIKVLNDVSGIGWGVFAGPAVTTANAYLVVGTGGQGWRYADTLGTNVNDDDFHVFRLAQEPGAAKYSVWRDGVLLSGTLGSAYTYNRDGIWFGDGSGGYAGEAEIDYVRFTSGAYAPAIAHTGNFNPETEGWTKNPGTYYPTVTDGPGTEGGIDYWEISDLSSAGHSAINYSFNIADDMSHGWVFDARVRALNDGNATGMNSRWVLLYDGTDRWELGLGTDGAFYLSGGVRIGDPFDTTHAYHDYKMYYVPSAISSANDMVKYYVDDVFLGSVTRAQALNSSIAPKIVFGSAASGAQGTARWSDLSLEMVPEPSSLALLGLSLAGIVARRRRRRASGGSAALVIALALVLTCSGPASAGLLRQDSADFANKYEANADLPQVEDPGSAWTLMAGANPLPGDLGVANGILSWTGGTTHYWNAGAAGYNQLTNANGYTFEVRAKLAVNGTHSSGILGVWASDGRPPAESTRDNGILMIDDQRVGLARSPNTWYANGLDNTDDFHIFRLVNHPGTDRFDVYRDGRLITASPATGYSYGGILRRIGWGPGLTGSMNGDSEIDYFRWDPTGAYRPPIAHTGNFSPETEGWTEVIPVADPNVTAGPGSEGGIDYWEISDLSTAGGSGLTYNFDIDDDMTHGWVVNARVRALNDGNPAGIFSRVLMVHDGTDRWDMALGTNGAYYYRAGFAAIGSPFDTTDTYHDYTMHYVPSPSASANDMVKYYVDGVFLGSVTRALTLNSTVAPQIIFGSGTSGGMGTARWSDISLEVVPEPTSLSLLGLGALALVRRKRRRSA